MHRFSIFLISLFCFTQLRGQLIEPHGPVPTRNQVAWHQLEYYLFIHFGPNTFTNLEWGHGAEDPNVFNPTAMDCRQWARIARESGAKGIIITAKHHDGFNLYPSKQSRHTVKQSRWRDGKGDVLKDLSEACRAEGLKFGVYISPWDRNHPLYGTPKYNKVFVKTIKEVTRNYGELFELWWDGANGEGPNGRKQEYDFRRFEKAARRYAPNTLIFSDIGPDIRWVGNERGITGETNWSLLDTAGFKRGLGAPPTDTLNQGNMYGAHYIPAEADVSIRPGWFYHQEQDSLVKSPEELMDIYLKSVGRGSTLLLNVPPDRRGLFHENDSAALMQFKALRDSFFHRNLAQGAEVSVSSSRPGFLPAVLIDGSRASHWAPAGDGENSQIELKLPEPQQIKAVQLQEYIELGQRVSGFTIEADTGNGYTLIGKGTTIGYKRIIPVAQITTSSIRITITGSKALPVLSEISLF